MMLPVTPADLVLLEECRHRVEAARRRLAAAVVRLESGTTPFWWGDARWAFDNAQRSVTASAWWAEDALDGCARGLAAAGAAHG